jgi:hypothetical protein
MDRLMYLKYAELSSVHQCMYDEERALNKKIPVIQKSEPFKK